MENSISYFSIEKHVGMGEEDIIYRLHHHL